MADAAAPRAAIRPDMVSSAISFLRDPKVQTSTVSQRISFLESKGLSTQEIDEALRQTGAGGGAVVSAAGAPYAGPSQAAYAPPPVYPQYGAPYPPYAPNAQQQQQARDWRDWFIMAVVSGTVGYGVISLAKRYLLPHLKPPNADVLESDQEALTAKYDEVAAQLSALETETKAVKAGIEEQKAAVEATVKDVEEAVGAMRMSDKKRDEEMDKIKSEVEHIKSELPRLFEQSRAAQSTSLADLQNELKSLKSLLVSRSNASATSGAGVKPPGSPYGSSANVASYGAAGGTSSSPSASTTSHFPSSTSYGAGAPSSTSAPNFGKPSIPAWQLVGGANSTGSAAGGSSAGGSGTATPANADEPKGTSAAQAGEENAKKAASVEDGATASGYEISS